MIGSVAPVVYQIRKNRVFVSFSVLCQEPKTSENKIQYWLKVNNNLKVLRRKKVKKITLNDVI